MREIPMICKTCRWYDEDEDDKQRGLCRRHIPTVNVYPMEGQIVWTLFPSVQWDDWCGEWTEAVRCD